MKKIASITLGLLVPAAIGFASQDAYEPELPSGAADTPEHRE